MRQAVHKPRADHDDAQQDRGLVALPWHDAQPIAHPPQLLAGEDRAGSDRHVDAVRDVLDVRRVFGALGWTFGYHFGMDKATLHVLLPNEVVERLDERARDELRSRSGMAAWLIASGLRERAGGLADDKREVLPA